MSRVCEEFHCRPSQAQRELDLNPDLVFTILELRGLANARQAIEDAHALDREIDPSPTIQKVMTLQIEGRARPRTPPTP